MTPQQYVGMAVRLFSIWVGLGAIRGFAFLSVAPQSVPVEAHALRFFVTAVWLLVALVLWFFPMFVAHKLIPRPGFTERVQLPSQQALTVATVVVALLVLLLNALPTVISYISVASTYIGSGQPITMMDPDRHLEFVGGLVEALVGGLLLLRAEKFSTWAIKRGDA